MYDGKAIREKREALQISAPKLAKQLGISVDNLYKWEKFGFKPKNDEDYRKIMKWLNGYSSRSERAYYQEKYIKQLEKRIEELEAANILYQATIKKLTK